MCRILHKIIITNVKNGEAFSHEIVLIKGCVNKCAHEQITVKRKNSSVQHFTISLSGEFKILCQLAEGYQIIEIEYCNHSINFECVYKKSCTPYQIQPLYLVCKDHNGCFTSSLKHNTISEACKIITLGLKLVQCLYAEKIVECGLTRKSFTLKSECVPFASNLDVNEVRSLDENALWSKFAYEIINSKFASDEKLKFVAFIGCTLYEEIYDNDYSYENIKKHTKGNAALGGGGLALFGSGCLYTWPTTIENIIPCFKNNAKIDLKRQLDDSNYRRTFGGCYATTIGTVCHEIGHIFDLGHTRHGIMGKDFDYINRVFTVDNTTDILPDRLFSDACMLNRDKRLTNIKRSNQFLNNYHEQKKSDGIFFTRNCALILFYHKWLNNYCFHYKEKIVLDKRYNIVKSNIAVKVIEVRNKTNALVEKYMDFTSEKRNKVQLSPDIDYQKYDVFVITAKGDTRLFT